jgi:ectoine hydroxylase-related dioxygenase (phytanoyl-CoA dioxygenase family)
MNATLEKTNLSVKANQDFLYPGFEKDFWENGYCVFRNVFSAEETKIMHDATDRVKDIGIRHKTNFRHGNLRYWVEADPVVGMNVRGMQWPAHLEPSLESMRVDQRMLRILKPLIGDNVRQIINQIHWKTPGSKMSVNYHIDRQNRLPKTGYRNLEKSYVQTGLAIDPQTKENGALKVLPGSHKKLGKLTEDDLNGYKNPNGEVGHENLVRWGYDWTKLVEVIMEPGDVAIWHVDLIHGSDLNLSKTMDRCLYINGFVNAADSMLGQWAFIQGQSIPLPPIDVPVLVQLEDIFHNLTPYFPDAKDKLTD